MDPGLRDRTLRWIADDPEPADRAALQQLLVAAMTGADPADLAGVMGEPLRFGTAGLRGPVRPGPAGMNVAVVRRATAGLAAWLVSEGHRGGPVVVGRDARHGSEAFARAAAGVLAAAGFAVHVLPGAQPTPLLAFAVQRLRAVAGVQITASHNPPQDNGYKVYLGTGDAPGAQLAPPADARIEAAIGAAPAAVSVPEDRAARGLDPTEDYLARMETLRHNGFPLRIALTPLHGVGGATAVHALARTGFTDVHVVAEQARPDPDFPTVAFPNPEEPGVTDLLLALAAERGADLAIALDPDADRCAIGVPAGGGPAEGPGDSGPGGATGDGVPAWRMLTGDETGALLGDHLLRHSASGQGSGDRLVATTVVSSSLLGRIAAAHGARFAETLTGFKWIVRAGPGLVYGYEEALGHCVDPDAVRDKDGIATAVVLADLAAGLKAEGRTLLDRLDELFAAHGVHRTAGLSLRMPPAQARAVVERLGPPGWEVDRPAPDVLRLRRPADRDGRAARLVVRPSGTEPKLKAYLEVVEPPDANVAAAKARADERLADLRTEAEELLR
ncbi:phospho-sugar mutase [Pseudonocardia ailaonensis]|uniref:Phospho-sugar mutase n=1 Tax=Pseudonocardia ailaonensis TaxID=367279 RepID=A0ABN2NPW6_9PSEU